MSTALNILIEQGTTFKSFVTLSDDDAPLNLTGYTFVGTLKRDVQSANSTALTCSLEDANNGIFSMSLAASISEAMKSGRYVYDIISIDAEGVISRTFEGIATLTKNITPVPG
jgi:hypothetical protein